MIRLLRWALAFAVLVSASCGNGQPAEARPRSSATVAIAEPDANATVDTKTFRVEIDLEGGRIVKETSRDLTPDDGHVHVSIDGQIQSQTFGLVQDLKTPPPGKHLLQVEFVAKDHGPFEPRVVASIPFEVKR
jgi:hypothetical protein